MPNWFKKIDIILDRHVPILLLLALLILLRLPNLVEPYWYGDEAIYLTIGTAMRQGERLYLQIIDHKTPIIYYLAMVPTQFWFRVLNISAMAISTVIFYFFCKKLFSRNWVSYFATLVFVLLTTLPALEGNIPNGELFVMFFILMGVSFLMKTGFFNQFFASETTLPGPEVAVQKKESLWLVMSGVFFGLGILTKVPGLFDVLGFLSIGWFSLLRTLPIFDRFRQNRTWKVAAREKVISTLLICAGVVLPILYSIVYYVIRGSGKAYLDYGLLYNFHYAESWKLNLSNPLLVFGFSLMGKAVITGVIILILTLSSRFVRRKFQFIATWFGLAFFATLLSNRPYPHYFLQLVPPFALLLAEIISILLDATMARKVKQKAEMHIGKMVELGVSFALMCGFVIVVIVLQLRPYPTVSYYSRFFSLLSGKMSPTAYRNSFESLMADNYAASDIISRGNGNYLFIWGTDPGLYALSKKSPVGRFTVLFHIRDFQAEHETYLDFVAKEPPYAVVIKNQDMPDEIKLYLEEHYIPNTNFEHFILWKRIPS